MKVSVIIPVYQAEAFIRKCLDSLMSQTFNDFEVIMIDDGSKDSGGKICDEYARGDERFKVIHQENGGVSSARQKGMDIACGEYSIFVDSDDWVEPDMLECLYNTALSRKVQYLICDYYENTLGSQKYIVQKPTVESSESLSFNLMTNLHGSLWNKFVETSFYKKVKAPLGINCMEDGYINQQVLQLHPTVGYLDKAFYHYIRYINSNSLTSSVSPMALDRDLELFDLYENLFAGKPELLQLFHKRFALNLLVRAFNSRILKSGEFKRKYGFLKKYLINNNLYGKYKRFLFYLSCIGLYGFAYCLKGKD